MQAEALYRGVLPGLLIALAGALLLPLAWAQSWGQVCVNSSNFADKSSYQANIKTLSITLPKNAASSSNLFAKASVGAAPDIVYALTLCSGDGDSADASGCESCVAAAFQDAQRHCGFNKDATVYYDACYLRFSNTNFLASTSNDNTVLLMNGHNVTSGVRAFDSAVGALLNATGNYAASNSTRRYATGEYVGLDNSNQIIYGLTQCTPDLLPADCRSCLWDILRIAPWNLSGSIGGRIIGVRCNFRPEIPSRAKKALKKIERGQHAVFDLPTLQEATDNFHENNKLGEGGFGTVYRGRLPDGQDIAVKKLCKSTKQGLNQLHNEVQVLAELQHMNLVRLLGFCLHGNEVMLVYEHVKNGSLDKVLFDPSRRNILNWEQKFNIILGITKGIMYFHEDSSIRIVHRDLKANNILLDENMNPKIADFGLARLLGHDHTRSKTTRVAGTFGYMAPEYALSGNVSPKIDIFSYGILVLEIITGRRNGSSNESNQTLNLLTDVWNYWKKGEALQLIDQSSLDGYSQREVLRCIHIGLLCVQEHPDDRPNISTVVLMLTKTRVKLQQPKRPAFFFGGDSSAVHEHLHKICIYDGSDVIVGDNISVNNVTITEPYPR